MVSRVRLLASGGLVCALLLGGVSFVQAQQRKQENQQRKQDSQKSSSRSESRSSSSTEIHAVSTVVGGTVMLEGDTEYGTIEDVVFTDSGCIDYVVVGYEDKYYPVPWGTVRVDYGQHVVHVGISKDRIVEAPTIAHGRFAEISSSSQKIHTFWGESRSDRSESRDSRRANGKSETRSGDRKDSDDRSKSDSRSKDSDRGKSETRSKDSDSRSKDSDRGKSETRSKDSDRSKDSGKDSPKSSTKGSEGRSSDSNKKSEGSEKKSE